MNDRVEAAAKLRDLSHDPRELLNEPNPKNIGGANVMTHVKTDNLICSNCGETFCADPDGINTPIDWTYCPNCGYRIVETNSGEDNNSER